MKKYFLVAVGLVGLLLVMPTSVNAQDVALSKKEIKATTSLHKAKSSLEKSQHKIAALRKEYDSKRKKFEKQNSKGNLSPNAVASHAKILNKLSKQIQKEQNTIKSLEKYIAANELK